MKKSHRAKIDREACHVGHNSNSSEELTIHVPGKTEMPRHALCWHGLMTSATKLLSIPQCHMWVRLSGKHCQLYWCCIASVKGVLKLAGQVCWTASSRRHQADRDTHPLFASDMGR